MTDRDARSTGASYDGSNVNLDRAHDGRGPDERVLAELPATVDRLGVVLAPDGSTVESGGVLNPASARTRDGKLLLYPRIVEAGNISRVGICEERGDPSEQSFKRLGFALEPEAPYELRSQPGGYGCEDPRVAFIPVIDRYVMTYTAYGPLGPRIAVALSHDGYAWERLGLMDFSKEGLPNDDDKDGAFFSEPVISPAGVVSLAFYHRPMLHVSTIDGRAAIPLILDMPARDREGICIAYVPLEPVLADVRNLLKVAESTLVVTPSNWDRIKTGAGTPPVLIEEGWLSVYHGVDPIFHTDQSISLRYSAGVVVHDRERPHIVLYRSESPVMAPDDANERSGVVNDVVFPTGIDHQPDAPARTYDIYYGMADTRVGLARFAFGASVLAAKTTADAA